MHRIKRSDLTISVDRQRGPITPEAIADLAESIEKHGLFHPPVCSTVEGRLELRAGETRVRAIDFLALEGKGFSHGGHYFPPGELPIADFGELTPIAAFEVELEENLRRTDLPWVKQTSALAQLHLLKLSEGLSDRSALAATEEHVAKITGREVRSLGETKQDVLLGSHMKDPDIAAAKTKKEALKVLSRKLQKKEDANAAPPVQDETTSFINQDCLTALAALEAASFDAVCTDPPYGIGITQLSYQNASEQEYDDSYEAWQTLMPQVFAELSRVLKPNAAGYMFCDWSRFAELRGFAEAAGFETFPRPFIWDRSPDGRLTTPEKWPRRCYECILFFRRGDRELFEVRGDVLRYPADRATENYHGAKKPVELYIDLLQRIVRPGDGVLDPFAGSGPLSRAAKKLNLRHLSIEKDASYYGLMLRLYEEWKP